METVPNNLLFPFASNIRRTLQKSKTEQYDENDSSTSKADVLLKESADRGRKEENEANGSPSVINRCSDVMNGDGLHELDNASSRHLTAECSI